MIYYIFEKDKLADKVPPLCKYEGSLKGAKIQSSLRTTKKIIEIQNKKGQIISVKRDNIWTDEGIDAFGIERI